MAAPSESMAGGLEIVELRHLGARELAPLLLEETVEWQRELDWDFGRSADLVSQYADMRAIMGSALLDRGEVAGYGYSVLEEKKGLIGDVYVRPAWRDGGNEIRLFRAILDGLIAVPGVRRIESQLMLLGTGIGKALQRERFIKLHERVLMKAETAGDTLAPGAAQRRFYIEPWADHHTEFAAGLIAAAYADHPDSQINDQYRTTPGARKFIHNIVQLPGCGAFFRQGSFVAFDLRSGRLAGIVLASSVGDEVGHITQLCVAPGVKGQGLGYELLRQSMQTLRQYGARRVSLTVTTANAEAIRLYQRCGFRDVRRFFAYVWDGY